MPRRSVGLAVSFAGFVTILALGDLPRSPAQAKPAAPTVPKEYPTLTTPSSLGAKRGSSFDLQLAGTNLAGVTGITTSFPATADIAPGQKDAKSLKVKLTVPPNAPLGLHSFRVATEDGISNRQTFVIDDLDSIPEAAGKNKTPETAQPISVPTVVTGVAEVESSDFFRFPVTAGKPITVEVLARRLGSPLDPVILFRDENGKELGGVYADDTPGLQSDCRLVYTPTRSGEIIVELRDSIYRGSTSYNYRLRVGSFPGVTTAFPLAIERGKKASIGFSGPDAAVAKPVSLTAPTDPSVEVVYATPQGADGPAGWPVPVLVTDRPESVEVEPNGDTKAATVLPIPGGVSGIFAEKNDQDTFKITAKKGDKLTIQVLTYEVNAPTEVYLRVLNAAGKELLKSDPTKSGVKLDFAPPADGDYFIVCEHLNYLAGPTEVYHLSVIPTTPDFAVTFGLDRIDLPVGGTGILPITGLTKLNGFKEPVELTIVGTDLISGKLMIPPSANPQPTAPLWLPIQVKSGVKPGPVSFRVLATATVDGKRISRVAADFDGTKAALGGMPNPPIEFTTEIAAAIVPAPPFELTVKLDKSELQQGGTAKGSISMKRDAKFAEEVQLLAISTPAGVTAKLKPIPKGKDSVEFDLTADAKAAIGEGTLILRGTAKVGPKSQSALTGPIEVKVIAGKKEPAKKK